MSCKVLLVEDCEDDLQLCKRYLEEDTHHSYECYEARTGQEAIDMYVGIMPDCLILDYKLPDKNGIEVLMALQKLTGIEELPVLILTGTRTKQLQFKH